EIVCEDTRRTLKLLNTYQIRKPLISYEKFSETRKMEHILESLARGRSIALLSDAGTPAISDPGSRIIARIREQGDIRIEALPGPSALVTAFSASGFEPPMRFIGFFPRTRAKKQQELIRMSVSTDVTVFYESPRRLLKTLKEISSTVGPVREVCIGRELTKVHEEYLCGDISRVIRDLEHTGVIGEVTVILKGAEREVPMDENTLRSRAEELLQAGHTRRDILNVLSSESGVNRNALYAMLLDIR
ncbi:MAG: 16S rRNA (cytidine(1402)-2'-O)-methyltransferase, partial [Desulfomonilia bacterium]|nr:16S rRNA (cytidine(1402)-2'-O)-methyltransferase [Desulfomonilia bacterium]